MSHNSVLFCNINRVEDLNKRISSRNIPDNAMKPNFSMRPQSTKQSIFPIIHFKTKPTERLHFYKNNTPNETFNPGTDSGQYSGFAKNVNVESILQNTAYEGLLILVITTILLILTLYNCCFVYYQSEEGVEAAATLHIPGRVGLCGLLLSPFPFPSFPFPFPAGGSRPALGPMGPHGSPWARKTLKSKTAISQTFSVFGHEWTFHSSKNSENPAFEISQGAYSAEIHSWG